MRTERKLNSFAYWIFGLSIFWVFYGLVGHSPWKPDEGYSVGLVLSMAKTGNYVVPMLAGEPFMEKPPFYFAVASFFGKALKMFPFHDAARLTSGFFTMLTILFLFLSVREVFGRISALLSVLLFIGAPGFCVNLHYLITDVALLAGFAMSLYGACLSQRCPCWGGFILGTGIGIGFLSKGLLLVGIWGIVSCVLICLKEFRTRAFWHTTFWVIVSFMPWFVVWPCALLSQNYALFMNWFWQNNLGRFFGFGGGGPTKEPFLFLKSLPWQSGLAFLGMVYYFYRAKRSFWFDTRIKIILTFFIVSFLSLSSASVNGRELYGMPLMLPVIFFGSEGFRLWRFKNVVRNFLRGLFLTVCICVTGLIWGLWFCTYLDLFPNNWVVLRRLGLIGGKIPVTTLGFIVAAIFLTIFSMVILWVYRKLRYNWLLAWSVSVTLIWGLAMTLWLPFWDAQKGYERLFKDMAKHLPKTESPYSIGLGESQRAILDYYQGIQTKRLDSMFWKVLSRYKIYDASLIDSFIQYEVLPVGSYLLVQGFKANNDGGKVSQRRSWRCLWKGKRWRDKRERYWLLQKVE